MAVMISMIIYLSALKRVEKQAKMVDVVSIPRSLNLKKGSNLCVHIFCDASPKAACAVGYLVKDNKSSQL